MIYLFLAKKKKRKRLETAGDGDDMVLWAQEISLHPLSCGTDSTHCLL